MNKQTDVIFNWLILAMLVYGMFIAASLALELRLELNNSNPELSNKSG